MKITVWENDMTEQVEPSIQRYIDERYLNKPEVTLLSAMARRDPEDILDSIKEANLVIMSVHLLEREQVRNLVGMLGWRMWGRVAAKEVTEFVILCMKPRETLQEIIDMCNGPWNNERDDPRNGLVCILQRARIYAVGDEKLRLISSGFSNRDFTITPAA